MYSHYGDSQYPHGHELGPIFGQMPVDPSMGPARYPYMPYYGSKGPETAQIAAAAMTHSRPHYGGEFAGMSNPEAVFNQGWMPGQGYMGPHTGKPGPYGIQGIPTYPSASPSYPGPPHPYSSAGQYHPYRAGSQSPMAGASHLNLMQQQQQQQQQHGGVAGHRFTPPGGSSSSGGRPDVEGSAMVENASYMGGIPGRVLPHGSTGSGSPVTVPWSSQQQLLAHGAASGTVVYRDQVPSPAPPTSVSSGGGGPSGGGTWSYHSPEYPSPRPATPDCPQGPSSSHPSASDTSTSQNKSTANQQGSVQQSGHLQKHQVDLSSPRNSELPKSQSVSSLRDALLATTSITSPSQPYASYSSPRMGRVGGGGVDHQTSPLTPSGRLLVAQESGSLISPQQMKKALLHQDSLLSTVSGQSLVDQQEFSAQSYSRQNSLMQQHQQQPSSGGSGGDGSSGGGGGGSGGGSREVVHHPATTSHSSSTSPLGGGGGGDGSKTSEPLLVENILGIRNDQPINPNHPPLMGGIQQSPSTSSSPLANSIRGGADGEGVSGSPHIASPLNPSVMTEMQDRRSPVPGRPELLRFPVRSPSFRSESQLSPLTEDIKKARKLPVSVIDRTHPSIASQYNGDQKRKDFLDLLFNFLDKEGVQIVRLPTICKVPFDLYQIFNSVQHHGGFLRVVEKRLWRDVIKTAYRGATSNPTSSSLRTLQQYYKKLLLPYECHVGSMDVTSCLSKLDNSVPSRHASTSSPYGSQLSSDGESGRGDRVVNHLSEVPPTTKLDNGKSVEGRINGETLCAVAEPGMFLEAGHIVERVNSQGNSVSVPGVATLPSDGFLGSSNGSGPKLGSADQHHLSSTSSSSSSSAISQLGGVSRDEGVTPQKPVNSHDIEDDQNMDFVDDSQASVETYPQPDLSEPLPEMSVQEAESVLGMSPITYPNHEAPGTPSTGVPSPTHFPSSHFQQQQQKPPPPPPPPQQQQQRVSSIPQPRTPGSVGTPTGVSRGAAGGGQDYTLEVNKMGGASTPGLNANSAPAPPAYPPPYTNPMDVPGGYHSHHPHPSHHPYASSPHPSGANYPAYNSAIFHGRPYEMSSDYHPGMSSPGMVYSSGRSPYSGMTPGSTGHQNSMDYHSPYHHPHLMPAIRDVPPYPSPHGMPASEWHWHQQQQQRQQQQQQQQQIMSSLPAHVQQSHMYQRMQQHHQQQQQQQHAINTMRHQVAMAAMQHSSTRASPTVSSSGSGSGTEVNKIHWQHEPSHPHKPHVPASSASLSSAKVSSEKMRPSPKPHHHYQQYHLEVADNKVAYANKSSDLVTSAAMVANSSSLVESLKRSVPDWSNCVEGTKPQLVKRRKLYGFHCGHVEPWRLMMSLKSGLLADSTWAMDTLTILLHDESTYGYFNLRHHHSLLNTLVDHFKVTLEAIFDISFGDSEKYFSGHTGRREEDDLGGVRDKTIAESMLEACQSDYDVLSEWQKEEDRVEKRVKTEVEDENEKLSIDCKELSIPVANMYDIMQLKLGKSDDISHIAIPMMEDELFPQQEVELNVLSESKRVEMERQMLLQRVDQTPVNILLQREALRNQIPLHRFSRLSHSPRRRDRNFFGSTRSMDSLSSGTGGVNFATGGEGDESLSKMGIKDHFIPSSGGAAGSDHVSGNTVGGSNRTRRESQCRSPPIPEGSDFLSLLGRKSTMSSSPEKKMCPSPLLMEENEVYKKEDLPLWSVPPSKEQLWKRCECLSNILRGLSFVTGNDVEFCQHPGMLVILGKLLLLHHYHLICSKGKKPFATAASPMSLLTGKSPEDEGRTEKAGGGMVVEKDSSVFFAPKMEENQQYQHRQQQHFSPAVDQWWWDCLNTLREDTLVILANISGQLDLSVFPEMISFPIIDGLLHWLVCPSSVATDPMPESSKVYSQSPQRLVVETFAKMTISEMNVDLILATPPLMRLDVVFSRLGQMVGQKKHPVVRQFALVLLSNLAQGHECCSRLIAQQKMVISLLLECLEMAEHMACMGQGSFESGYSKDDPSSLSVAMLRRAATTLHCISRVPANRTAFLPYRDRILYLATSQYVEPSVSSILMDMLYEFGKL